jgi:hypothetical protein
MKALRNVLALLLVTGVLPLFDACKKSDDLPPGAETFSSDVVTSWLAMQLKLAQTTPTAQAAMPRRFAYSAIALYESIVPGLASNQSIAPQLNGLSGLPAVTAGARYYWPASANAALAAMSRSFFPTASAANKASIDSLEAANAASYQTAAAADELSRSVEFGKGIAATVFDWSKTDGYDNATPYVLPVGTGLWVPTPPAMAPPALPNWGKCRPLVKGSDAGADQGVPTAYSEDPTSAYYAQAKEVYDISQNLTADQKATALFWLDNPDGKGYPGVHWMSILNQALIAQKPSLDAAAEAFAKTAIATSDASISLFKSKYQYNGLRPITYIRKVMNPTWNAFLATPAHPEYPSGHAVLSAAAGQALTYAFGTAYKFTDNTYNAVGLSPRSYNSFEEAAIEAGNSRVYAGFHYRKTCDVSQKQGKAVAQNINSLLKFKK